PVEGEPTIKPNVRKHAVAREDGRLVPCKGDGRTSEFHLTEYSAWLPRLLRLRKKIFYVARQTGQIVGNVLILYDFTMPGEIPSIMNIAHGNDALRDMQQMDLAMELPVADADNPFVDGIVPGVRGEKFLKVHPSKIGWVNNKTLLLKYLINDPTFLDEAGYLNTHVPFLPPMIEGRGVFVHFAPATLVADHIHHTGDGLSPWTFQEILRDNSIAVPGPPISSRPPALVTHEKPPPGDAQGNNGMVEDFVDVEEIVEGADENELSLNGAQSE
ncbi:hypothetical protein ANCDUO_24323, partial [Ancylostoma duodenale]